jgi:hypothetical protein
MSGRLNTQNFNVKFISVYIQREENSLIIYLHVKMVLGKFYAHS